MKRLLPSLLCLYLGLIPCAVHAEPTIQGVGLWWVSHGTGEPLQLRLYPDGTAWSDYPANNPGRWEAKNDRIVCLWADDWKEILIPSNSRWIKLGFRPGHPLTGPPSNQSSAIRASTHPDGWFGPPPTER